MTGPSGLADLVATALERPLVLRPPFERREAIVVLGSPLGPGDTLTPILAERVAAAVALHARGGGALVVATGGVTRGASRAEADVIGDALRAAGLDPIIENRARTTRENALYTARLVAARRVWLVTQPFHGRRAAHLFRAAGFDALPWHIADSVEYRDRRRAVRWLAREYASWLRVLTSR